MDSMQHAGRPATCPAYDEPNTPERLASGDVSNPHDPAEEQEGQKARGTSRESSKLTTVGLVGPVIGMQVAIKNTVTVVMLAAAIAFGIAGCNLRLGAAHVVHHGAVHIAVGRPSSQGTAPDVAHCQGVVCALDLTRAQTREFNANLNIANAGATSAAALCGLVALVTGPGAILDPIICAVGVTFVVSFLLNAASRAAGDNGCLRVQFFPPAFSDDHSSYCH